MSTGDLTEVPLPDGPVSGLDAIGSRAVVRLPLDGPDRALPYAAEALHAWFGPLAAEITVIADRPGGGPVDHQQLGVLRRQRLRVGVDVTRCRWVSADGSWLAGRTEIRWAPGIWGRADSGERLAGFVSLLVGDVDTPLRRWLDRIVTTGAGTTARDWVLPLQALYVQSVASPEEGKVSGL